MWLLEFNGLDLRVYLYKDHPFTLVNHLRKSINTYYSLFFLSFCLIYFLHFILLLLCDLGRISSTTCYQHVTLAWEQDPIPKGIILSHFF